MPAPVPREVVEDFARRLYAKMSEKGLSQSDLARKVWGSTVDKSGKTVARNRDRISQYLRGRSLPDKENTAKIAKALGCSPEDLVPTRAPVIDEDNPEVSVTALAGNSEMVRLIVNKVVPFSTAADIMQKLSGA